MSLTDSSSDFSHGYMEQLRLPMLTIPSKQGVSVDLTSPLAELIRTEFGEDPTQFRQEVREFNQLRESAIRPSRDNNGTSTVRRYYAQLCLLPTRFAAARSSMQVTFIWSDAFTEKESANSLLLSETSAVLFNLGALHSRLGSDLPDELRSACTHFQCSAGAFYLLQTSVLSSQLPLANTHQIDMCNEIIAFCKNLMLAQAQECMVEKSLLERKRPSLVTKVAWEVSTLYLKAIDLLDTQVGAQVAKKNKNWQKFLQTKFHIYQCVANYCQALSSEEETNYGQSIGYLQLAADNILAASKVVKVLQPPLKNAVKYLTDLIQTKTQSSTQANSQVYHQLVPQYAELEEITGALLVKPIEFSTSDKSVLGTDIFCKLVPMSVLESNSLYSEEKANLLRSVCESIQDKDRELGEFLSRIDIDEVLSYNENKIHIPSDVSAVRVEVAREEGRVEGMEALLQSVLQLSNQIHRRLDEICMYLTRDTPELANQILEFQNQADKIDEYLLQGDKSNQELHQVMKELKPKLALLTATEQTFVNSLPKIDLMTVTFDEAAESRLQLLMEKIQEMQAQRSTLEQQLRKDMDTDDITNQLIASNGSNQEEVFGMGMKKHKDAVAVIRQNCQAQDNILKAMTETNASLAGLRKELNSVRTERENVFKGLVDAWKRLGSTEDSLKDGMKFYQNLDRKTLKLFDTIKSDLLPPPIQQTPPTATPVIPLHDSSYKPISPFMSPPMDSLRPPVPSRRLKPSNQTEETVDVDETELALLDWAASKQENKLVNNEPEVVKDATCELAIVVTPAKPTEPHIPQAPTLATPVFDTSGLTQLIQSSQSESNVSFSSLQTGLNGMNQSVMEISANVSAVVNHNNQSNAAISSLHQVVTNHNASIEQLSSHIQSANQNVVYTSQLIKLVETNLLAKIESVEMYTQESMNRLTQLFEHVTQKQMDVVLKLEPLISKINNNLSSTSEEVVTLQTAVSEVREDLKQLRHKQDSILLLPNQSDVRVGRDPLSLQDRPKEGRSEVGELWNLLGKKSGEQSVKSGLVLSDNTAFSPISHRASSVQSEPGVAGQSMVLPVLNQSITSLDPFPTTSMVPLSYSHQPAHSQLQPHVASLSTPYTPQPSVMPIQTLHSTPAVSLVQQFPPQQILHPNVNVFTSQTSQPNQYPPQPFPLQPVVQSNPQLSLQPIVQSNPQLSLQPAVQSNPQLPIQSAVQSNPQLPIQSAVQSNPQLPIQSAVQSNPQLPIQSAVQSNPQLPIQSAVQSNPQLPIQSAVQSNPQLPIQSAVQSNPQLSLQPIVQSNPLLSLQPAVQSNASLTPQQHAYLQMVQKQLSSNSQPLTPDQLIIIQRQLLLLSQSNQ